MISSLPKKIFFSGIGGIGMSGLALILTGRGYEVSGSDIVENEQTKRLQSLGVRFFLGQKEKNLIGTEMLIVSAAIKSDNPEIAVAESRNIPIVTRSELLGFLMSQKKGIAIAGTHGKTTTSTMLSMVLEDAGLDPAMAIGGEVKNIGGNAKDGQGEFFVAEACEYERAFLDLHPYAAIITNIEEDHLDTYGDLAHILETFKKFLNQINPRGFLVVSSWDANIKEITNKYNGKIIRYGFKDGEFRARAVTVKDHHTNFKVMKDGDEVGELSLIVPGAHNILNALAVTATAMEIGVPFEKIKKSLSKFTGAKRRFEIKGEKRGILVIDDYAHHPTEIQATLDGLKSYYPERKVWCIFQPHQYSRTRFLLHDFAISFKNVDKVIIPEIYEARDTEEDKKAVSGKILATEINNVSKNATFISNFDSILDYLEQNAVEGDIVITIGAGNVYQLGETFLAAKNN